MLKGAHGMAISSKVTRQARLFFTAMKLKPIFDIHVLFIAWLMHLSNCTFQFLHPDISFLGSSTQLNCSTSKPFTSLLYEGPGKLRAPACEASFSGCTTVNGFKASFINATHTSLRILNVEPPHAGTWACAEGATGEHTSCRLQVAKKPTCSITSKEDTDVLAQYQELTLTVDIQDYYCSTALTFSLQTGNVTTLLMEADSVANVTHNTSSVTLNVTDSHLGIVGLVFSCHNSQWNLPFDGVTELKTKTAAVSENDGLVTTSTPIIAAGVVGAIVFLIIVVIIIVFIVKRKQVTRIKPQTSLKPPSPPFPTVELNLPSGSKNISVINA